MLKTRQFSPGDIQVHLNALLLTSEYQMEMWSCGLTLEEVRTEVGCKARLSLAAFGDKWVGEEPKVGFPECITALDSPDHRLFLLQPEASLQNPYSAATLAITGLHDIEESILSPKWGMTGRSDASVHVTIKQTAGVETSASTKGANLCHVESGPKPLEIKSGSNWAMPEHEAQTRLYALMMEERYRESLLSLANAASLSVA
jgi:DNA replication ATP-dependent helicase Dna2